MKLLATTFVLASTIAASGFQGTERSIVIPEDTTPFTVAESDIVRLTGKGIAGSVIEAKVEGPAKVIAESTITTRVKGRMPIGTGFKEFDVKSSGRGDVKVTISVKPPQPGSQAETKTYQFKVE